MAKYDSSLDVIFTALGDPTRRGILARLGQGPASVSELAEDYDISLPSFMGHLRKLEEAGLVTSEKQGRVRTCALNPEAMGPAKDWLEEQRTMWEARLDRFEDYVTTLMKERQNGPQP